MPGVVAWPGVGCVMTRRRPSPAAPGPLEGYAARFDDLFTRVAQRRGVGGCPAGLLAPRGPNKTPPAPAAARPVGPAPDPPGPGEPVFRPPPRWASHRAT